MEAEDFENIIENKIDITQQKPKAKPKKKLSELQLETIRRNMMLGRKKRAENIAKKKQAVPMARSETLHTMTKDEDTDTDSDSDYEELVIQAPQPKQQKEHIDNDVMSKLMADMSFIKEQLNKQEGKGPSPTIVNVQVPPQQVQPTEPVEAVNQRKRILMNFGR